MGLFMFSMVFLMGYFHIQIKKSGYHHDNDNHKEKGHVFNTKYTWWTFFWHDSWIYMEIKLEYRLVVIRFTIYYNYIHNNKNILFT